MSALRQWGPSVGMLLLALCLGLAVGGSGSGEENPLPSVKNPGPLGLEVLRTWLDETGRPALVLDAALTELPPNLAVLVLAAPRFRGLSEDELGSVRGFVERGGTLIWLVPTDAVGAQSRLAEWLKPERGGALGGLMFENSSDLTGRSLKVAHPVGLLAGVEHLRLSSGVGLSSEDQSFLSMVEGGAVLAKTVGRGEVWLSAGPELAEARRLELDGNLRFWANAAARGPIGFDEFHHVAESGPPLPANFPAAVVQLSLLGLAFALVYGRRLGPPRATPVEVHRSSLEYVDALAALTRKAKVEPELCLELHARLRRLMHDRLGVAVARPDRDAAHDAAMLLRIPAEPLAQLLVELGHRTATTPQRFARLAREAAGLERTIAQGL